MNLFTRISLSAPNDGQTLNISQAEWRKAKSIKKARKAVFVKNEKKKKQEKFIKKLNRFRTYKNTR